MSNIRKAHSVEIIDKRLRHCEAAGPTCDAMELASIYDELSRVERKWLEKASGAHTHASGRTRPLANEQQINQRFKRLSQLIDAALRRSGTARIADSERPFLETAAAALKTRSPLQRK